MLSKCLNPSCSRPFRFMHEGRVFQLEIPTRMAGSDSVGRLTEYFWLCAQCCATLKVVMKNGVAGVEPRYLELPWNEPPSGTADESISGPWRSPARDR
jgi:hypothetical protein